MLNRQVSLRTGLAALVVSLLALAGGVAFLLSGETGSSLHGEPPRPPIGTVADVDAAEYLGDQACAPCHPSIFAAHHRSRHAGTLHPLLAGHPASLLPDHDRFPDPATGLQYALQRRQGQYRFAVLLPGATRSEPVEFVFGSGKTGITLVSRASGGAIREFRMSYFPSRHRWEVTPGQRGPAPDPLGAVHNRATAQRCFSCHATVVAESRVLPEPRFMGVGCEACHGGGRRHIEAIQSGRSDRRIDNPGHWDGERVNALCGRCHRSQQELDPLDTFSLTQTQRFQPMGLAKSACFCGSAGRLSCVTCHDAHENARTDAAHYEAVCLSCHTGKAGVQVRGSRVLAAERTAAGAGPRGSSGVQEDRSGDLNTPGARPPPLSAAQPQRPGPVPHNAPSAPPAPAPERLNTGRPCPVNPRQGCITCHMPHREVVRGISMADHWIRVVRSSSGSPSR